MAANTTNPPCTASPTSTVAITIPAVTIAPNAAVGATLGNPGTATVAFNCSTVMSSNSWPVMTIQASIEGALDATNGTGSGIRFATNVPGIAVQLTATPNQAASGANGPGGVPGWELNSRSNTSSSITTTFTAQLIKTGAIASGAGTVSSISLVELTNYSYGYSTSAPYYVFVTLSPVTVNEPTCSVSTSSQNIAVTLPDVSIQTLSTAGSVAGMIPFSISIAGCPSSVTTVTTFFNSGATIDSTSGNLLNSGAAKNVEVQLLNGAGGSAAAQSAIKLAGTTPNAQNSSQYSVVGAAATLNYYAQYIASGGAAGAGSVSTSVTFTIAYP